MFISIVYDIKFIVEIIQIRSVFSVFDSIRFINFRDITISWERKFLHPSETPPLTFNFTIAWINILYLRMKSRAKTNAREEFFFRVLREELDAIGKVEGEHSACFCLLDGLEKYFFMIFIHMLYISLLCRVLWGSNSFRSFDFRFVERRQHMVEQIKTVAQLLFSESSEYMSNARGKS